MESASASTSASVPAPVSIEFSPFHRLPVELRVRIWSFAVEQRVVHVEWSRPRRQCLSPDIPAILQVSRESRAEGLKIYHAVLNTSNSSTPVYINFDLDTVSFRWKTFGRRPAKHAVSLGEDCRRIKFLMIDACVRLNDGMELIKFESLEELQIEGCTDEVPDAIGNVALFQCAFKPWVKSILPGTKARKLPRLRCLDQGTRCRDHWWFGAWNESCTRAVFNRSKERGSNCWQLMYTVINDLAHGCLQERESHGQSIEVQTIT
ncbi:hypothetical protein ONS95_014646 [Cadophora gregata]|uniref:uncharacterized protein n=1 Tax=Cadophora gregata TaxID=51156 RepID=UPI0026DBF87E|nr:uncharacterized protein ONS95_014646 [Cadophora gregata]KAK0112926.1 hypothetical protein ONS95_014646 [Cadophora gregata]KAK0125050.1 hypothetical protein ONS96_008918 [Cadophora gregata f. sp. sojae]